MTSHELAILVMDGIMMGMGADMGRENTEKSRKFMVKLLLKTRRFAGSFVRHDDNQPLLAVRSVLVAVNCGLRGYLIAGPLGPQDDDIRRLTSVIRMTTKTLELIKKKMTSPDLERSPDIDRLLKLYCEVEERKFSEDPTAAHWWNRLYDVLLELKRLDDLGRMTLVTL
jgi:hypothetical protein